MTERGDFVISKNGKMYKVTDVYDEFVVGDDIQGKRLTQIKISDIVETINSKDVSHD